jgi:hypothetical protein
MRYSHWISDERQDSKAAQLDTGACDKQDVCIALGRAWEGTKETDSAKEVACREAKRTVRLGL